MKMPIAWHERNLENRKITLMRKEASLEILQKEINQIEDDINNLARQIIKAEQTGKEGFDSDRYLKRRQ